MMNARAPNLCRRDPSAMQETVPTAPFRLTAIIYPILSFETFF